MVEFSSTSCFCCEQLFSQPFWEKQSGIPDFVAKTNQKLNKVVNVVGEHNGAQGVFPANYVSPISSGLSLEGQMTGDSSACE